MQTDKTKLFIEKARAVHGDRYDYSRVKYVHSKSKVKITCKEHGVFEQAAGSHLAKIGCPACGGRPLITTRVFIERARNVHGNIYDYSGVIYVNGKKKVTIRCGVHGIFEQAAGSHLSGYGCPQCGGSAKLTTDTFISRSKEVHGDRYDYSKVVYSGYDNLVTIGCEIHGFFEQTAFNHLRSTGCVKCSGCEIPTTESFVSECSEVHSGYYSYGKTVYTKAHDYLVITCPVHGDFNQQATTHQQGGGCDKCAAINRGINSRSNTCEFIRKAILIHGKKYDYSKVKYKSNHSKVDIICSEHGAFKQTPGSHLAGSRCGKCAGKGLSKDEWIEKFKQVHGDNYCYDDFEYVGPQHFNTLVCSKHGSFDIRAVDHANGRGCAFCSGSAMNTETFISAAKNTHGDRYDYSLVDYRLSNKKVIIICKDHGSFEQAAGAHISGRGCPECSKGGGWAHEGDTYLYLLTNGKGECKIGIAIDCQKRLSALNKNAPFTSTFQASWTLPSFKDAHTIEQRIHRKLKHLNCGYVAFDGSSEWFAITPSKAVKVIGKVIERAGQLTLAF